MPRPYNLGRRAEQQAATRARILDAAIQLYRTVGFAAATTSAVAEAADLARATVRNHFATPLDLARAASERVLDDLRPPDATLLEGLATPAQRLGRLTRELVAFFERGEPWWSLLQRDRDLAEAWSGAAATYEVVFSNLLRVALGPLAEDPTAMAVSGTAIGPSLHFALRGAGLSQEQAVEVQLDVLVPWVERRLGSHD